MYHTTYLHYYACLFRVDDTQFDFVYSIGSQVLDLFRSKMSENDVYVILQFGSYQINLQYFRKFSHRTIWNF